MVEASRKIRPATSGCVVVCGGSPSAHAYADISSAITANAIISPARIIRRSAAIPAGGKADERADADKRLQDSDARAGHAGQSIDDRSEIRHDRECSGEAENGQPENPQNGAVPQQRCECRAGARQRIDLRHRYRDQQHRERAHRRRIAEGRAPAEMATDHRAQGNAEHQCDREPANHDREGAAPLFCRHQRGDRNGRERPGECRYDATENPQRQQPAEGWRDSAQCVA